jgi:hypothetical protein
MNIMQNQHTKLHEKLAFEEPWIHHHSGGLMAKKEKVSLFHTAFQEMSLKWWKSVKNKTYISICSYKNMLL